MKQVCAVLRMLQKTLHDDVTPTMIRYQNLTKLALISISELKRVQVVGALSRSCLTLTQVSRLWPRSALDLFAWPCSNFPVLWSPLIRQCQHLHPVLMLHSLYYATPRGVCAAPDPSRLLQQLQTPHASSRSCSSRVPMQYVQHPIYF